MTAFYHYLLPRSTYVYLQFHEPHLLASWDIAGIDERPAGFSEPFPVRLSFVSERDKRRFQQEVIAATGALLGEAALREPQASNPSA